ncbi:M28 family peptidase [Acinetobacter variabilis]|uniref:M28 family peptidase n=1 Tax=Acinetobacter variabilis TaxID=70346 RepID=UPI003AF50AD9
MRTSLIIKRYCTFLLIILGLTSSVMSFAAPANFSSKQAQPEHLELFIKQIISVDEYRNFKNTSELNRVSAWLKEQMRLLGIPCQFQNYIVNSLSYRNVVCQLNAKAKTKLVIGAHYDVFSDLYGADNNASGVAGVLETARLLALQKSKLKHNIEFAFYTLEEPPYFKTEHMGSYLHAKALKAQKQKVKGVIILDSIGYYDENLVQTYPTGLKWIYPRHGNFIAAIGYLTSAGLTGDYCTSMQRFKRLDCQRFISPAFAQDMNFSGYLNYAKFNYSTMLITDTAHYRNPYYNTEQDTLDKLDLTKMAQVVNGLVDMVIRF